MTHGGKGSRIFSTTLQRKQEKSMQNDLKLLDASVDIVGNGLELRCAKTLYNQLKPQVDFYFDTPVKSLEQRT